MERRGKFNLLQPHRGDAVREMLRDIGFAKGLPYDSVD
jgi:hypothetical protein